MSDEQVRDEIIRYFKKCYELGFVNMFEGNVSARVGDKVLITPSQQNKETITPDMLSELSLDGEILREGGVRPSSEYRMHLALYRLRPDIRAIVHVHSPFATAWAMNSRPIRGDLAEVYMFFGGEIPVCSYGTPGTDSVFSDFGRFFVNENKDTVLLANHGLTAGAQTVEQAFAKAEAAEKLAKILSIAQLTGKPHHLTEREKEALLAKYRASRHKT
jgi:L-fuculose-phosphate aldolase